MGGEGKEVVEGNGLSSANLDADKKRNLDKIGNDMILIRDN
jgi:hypothetical protein